MSWTKQIQSETDPNKQYNLKFQDGVFSCSCFAWKNQYAPITARTCKHLIQTLGSEVEQKRAPESFAGLTRQKPIHSNRHELEPLPMTYHTIKTIENEFEKLQGWYYSVKLNGAFGRWQNGVLYTKSGRSLKVPEHILKHLPKEVDLDGEIYAEHNMQKVRKVLSSNHWDAEVNFIVFDMVDKSLNFSQRLEKLRKLHSIYGFKMVCQHKIHNPEKELPAVMKHIRDEKEEGLVFRSPHGLYDSKRSHTTLKWKPESVGIGTVTQVDNKKRGGQKLTIKEDDTGNDNNQFSIWKPANKIELSIGQRIKFKYYGRNEKNKPEFPQFISNVF